MQGQEDSELIRRAQQAAGRRDWLEAWRCWEMIRSHSPGYAPAHLGAGQALREAGRYDDAEATLGNAAERFPDNEQIAIARASLANVRRDWPAALSRWEMVRAGFPDNPQGYLGTINALVGSGCPDGAQEFLEAAQAALAKARQRGLDEAALLRMELELARARLDWAAVRQLAENIAARETAPSAAVLLAQAQACLHLDHPEEADRAAERALSVDAKLTAAWLVRVQVATRRGDGETALACYRALVEINPGVIRWRLKLIQLLSWLGQVKEALQQLEAVGSRWPADPIVKTFLGNYGAESEAGPEVSPNRATKDDPDYAKEEELRMIAEKAPGESQRVRPLLAAQPARDVLVAEVKGADTALLVFTGTNDEFSMPLTLLDRYLATLPLTTIYLKDFNRLRFLRGIQSLSEDLPGTVAALQEILNGLGVTRVCTTGNCVGGFAAIRYGVELSADRMIAFSPPTWNPREPLTKFEEGRRFMKNRLEASVPREMMDLRPVLESSAQAGQIELFYEEEDPRDRASALRLDGLPGVRLHPRPELTYRLVRRLASASDDFRGLLASLLGVGVAGAAE